MHSVRFVAALGLLLLPQGSLPRFEEYPVHEHFTASPAPVAVVHDPQARKFRTRLRAGAAKGPNFAGHYTVVTWRAGFPYGAMLAIVDATNGQVAFGPDIMFSAQYRLDSSLLIVDPPERVRAFFDKNPADPLRHAAQTVYYHWDGRRLIPLDSALVYPPHAP